MILSLKDYLRKKGAANGQGLRSCAPGLKEIRLRELLLGPIRVIIHLSDLHIGLNHDSGPEAQLQDIVAKLKETYQTEYLKPVVVITGDLLDHSICACIGAHIDAYCNSLQELIDDGFTVLTVPGNHDYSDLFDVDKITWLEYAPFPIGQALRWTAEKISTERGCPHDMVSGCTFVSEGQRTFNSIVHKFHRRGRYQQDGVFHEDWRSKGALYDLDFILLDGQDPLTGEPGWATVVGLGDEEKFFLRNGDLRLAHGWFHDIEQYSFRERVRKARERNSLPIVAMHYWTNYWSRDLLSPEEQIAVLAFCARGKVATDCNLTEFETAIPRMIVAAIRARILPKDDLLDIIQNALPSISMNLISQLCSMVDSYGISRSRSLNPNYQGSGDGTLIEEEEIFDILDRCHLLMVGHRHVRYSCEKHFQSLSREQFYWVDRLKKAKAVFSSGGISEGAIALAVRDLLDPRGSANMAILHPFVTKVASLVMSTDIAGIDGEARLRSLQNSTLAYYNEAGSTVPNADENWQERNGWVELKVNLNSGEIVASHIKSKLPDSGNPVNPPIPPIDPPAPPGGEIP